MSATQHTPGPWILSEYEVVRFGDTAPTKGCEIFCNKNNKVVCSIPDYRYHAEYDVSDRADARLITAAPDLLAALIQCREELRACQSVIHYAGGFSPAYVEQAQAAMKVADAALAKAGGQL